MELAENDGEIGEVGVGVWRCPSQGVSVAVGLLQYVNVEAVLQISVTVDCSRGVATSQRICDRCGEGSETGATALGWERRHAATKVVPGMRTVGEPHSLSLSFTSAIARAAVMSALSGLCMSKSDGDSFVLLGMARRGMRAVLEQGARDS